MDVNLPGDCGEWTDTPRIHTEQYMSHVPPNVKLRGSFGEVLTRFLAVVVVSQYGNTFPAESRHIFPACVSCVGLPDVARTEEVTLSCSLHFTPSGIQTALFVSHIPGCTPAEAVDCDEGHNCAPGPSGYTCSESASRAALLNLCVHSERAQICAVLVQL